MRLKRFVVAIALMMAAIHVRAGDFNVVGNMNVESNLAARSITLGGQTRDNWPSGGERVAFRISATIRCSAHRRPDCFPSC